MSSARCGLSAISGKPSRSTRTIWSAIRTATPVTSLVPTGSFPSGRPLANPRQRLLILAWMLGPRMLHDLEADSFPRGQDISLTAVAIGHAAVLFGRYSHLGVPH